MADLLFTMLQVNDVHLTPGDDPRNTQGKLRALLAMLGQPPLAPRPDLTLLAGDLVDLPGPYSIEYFAERARPLLQPPAMVIVGNHDVFPADAPRRDEPVFTRLGADPVGQALFYRGVLFLLLNDADGDRQGSALIEERNRWLAGQLEKYPEHPKIVAAHVPLLALRDPEPLATGFDFPTWKNQDPDHRLLELLEAHAETVIAVLSGHLHLTAHLERAGIHHIVPAGLMAWPHDVALYSFYENRIDVRMVSLPGDIDPGSLGALPLRNGVYDRHGRELTDALHPTARLFVEGLPEERAFTIALTGRKVIKPPELA